MRTALIAATAAGLVLATGAAFAAAAAGGLADWAGVYKFRFQNGTVQGDKYQSEDVLEILPVDASRAYVRADLDFFNGHICRFYGIAKLEGDALVYRGPASGDMGENCVLTLSHGKNDKGQDAVLFADEEGRCRAYTCGMRGAYESSSFAVSSKRKIRYAPRIRNSDEYKSAMKEAGAQ